MQEQRLTSRLQQYWDLLRKEKPYPDISHFNHATIEDLWPYCCQVSISGQGGHYSYKYEYMGPPIAILYGADLTGMIVDHRIMEFPGSVIHKHLDAAVRNREILKNDGHVLNKNGQMIKYRACFMPFGAHENVTHIIIGISCRVF